MCRPLFAYLCPVADFTEASCRQFSSGTCVKGGFCNFWHVIPISRALRDLLSGRTRHSDRSARVLFSGFSKRMLRVCFRGYIDVYLCFIRSILLCKHMGNSMPIGGHYMCFAGDIFLYIRKDSIIVSEQTMLFFPNELKLFFFWAFQTS